MNIKILNDIKFDYLKIAGVVLALVSAITSTLGARAILIASMGNDNVVGNVGGTALAVLFCFIIQGLVVTLILRMSVFEGTRKRFMALLMLLLLTWALSIGTSYGSYWNLLAKSGYESRVTAERIELTEAPIRDSMLAFGKVSSSFGYVASHASSMAELENSTGTSCGYDAGGGQGPRWRLRNAQNSQAQTHASNLERLNENLQATINSLNTQDDATMKTAFMNAKKLLADPAVSGSKTWMQTQVDGFTNGFETESGTRFECNDPKMVNLLNASMIALSGLPDLPSQPPTRKDVTHSEAMLKGYLRLMGPVASMFGYEPKGAEKPTGEDYAPLVFPLFVELIMSLLLWVGTPDIPKRKKSPWGPNGRFNPNHPGQSVFEHYEAVFSSPDFNPMAYDLLRNYIVDLPSEKMAVLAVPSVNGDDRGNALKLKGFILSTMSERDAHKFVAPIAQHFPFSRFPPEYKKRCIWKNKYTSDLYEVPANVLRKLQADALIHAASGAVHMHAGAASSTSGTVH